jgi:hypothetical protein
LQVSAILSYGTLSRVDVLRSEMLAAVAPELGSPLYWPARAMLNDLTALACVFTIGVALLAAAVITLSPRFEDHVMDAAGLSSRGTHRRAWSTRFRVASPKRALRHKEWMLLFRDPWLTSQTLMQILYLLPPWLLLWRSLEHRGAVLVLVPVLTMAGRAIGGRAGMAGDFWRGRARSGHDCAGAHAGDRVGQDRGRTGRGRDCVPALGGGTRIPRALSSSSPLHRRPKSNSGFAAKPSAAIFDTG